MKKDEKYLAKGIYSHPQVSGYLTVKQYIIIEQDGKKCLLLRFANEAEFVINAAEFMLKQLNSKGEIIETSRVRYDTLSIPAGEMYSADSGIVIANECVDVVVQMVSLVGGKYKYSFKNRVVTVHYDRRGYGERKSETKQRKPNSVTVKKNISDNARSNRLIAFVSVVIIIVALAIIICGRVFGHDDKKQNENNTFTTTAINEKEYYTFSIYPGTDRLGVDENGNYFGYQTYYAQTYSYK